MDSATIGPAAAAPDAIVPIGTEAEVIDRRPKLITYSRIPPKPSSHTVITGHWNPSVADQAAGRVPGYGVRTNIVNGWEECGHGHDNRVADRIGFYKRYCHILGVTHGHNLYCYNQKPFP
ncbi:hypothetical protein VPH35_140733 [Triticum aestivum]|uniref:chitinase n=1 Tax=Aegilops tauschii TaxID=37682 RepID=M8CTV8_AEGTA